MPSLEESSGEGIHHDREKLKIGLFVGFCSTWRRKHTGIEHFVFAVHLGRMSGIVIHDDVAGIPHRQIESIHKMGVCPRVRIAGYHKERESSYTVHSGGTAK